MLTREEIHNKKFDITKKGYDVHQVDVFLDEIAVVIGNYENDAAELIKFRELEKQLSSALVLAQSTATSIREKAESEAFEKISSAEDEAQKILNDAREQVDRQCAQLEAQKNELVEKVNALKDFVDTYKKCILLDMENHREAFEQGFLSDATYNKIEEALPKEEEVLAEEETLQSEANEDLNKVSKETEDNSKELDTGDIESIDLSEIVNNLPNADDELKKLIDDII